MRGLDSQAARANHGRRLVCCRGISHLHYQARLELRTNLRKRTIILQKLLSSNPGGKVHKPPMPSVEECQTVEEQIAALEADPSNKKLLRQIGVRESLFRCLAAKTRFDAQEEMKDRRILALVTSMMGFEMEISPLEPPYLQQPQGLR